MRPQLVVAYGRVEPQNSVQVVGRRFQRASIKKTSGSSRIEILFDVATGDSPLGDRPALMQQLHEAHRHGVSLCVESMDRILSTYSQKRIKQFRNTLDELGVQIAVAHINPVFHRRIRRILAGSKSASIKRKSLTQRVDQYLRWRHGTIFPGVGSAHNISLVPYRDLKNSGVYPALERCAKHLLKLDAHSHDFDWYLHAYLGAAFEHRANVLRTSRHEFSADGDQLSYGKHPHHAELFQKIHELELTPLTTVDGRKKSLSNQLIADELNKRGFCNLRGTPFSRKTIFQIRRGTAYLGRTLADSSGISIQPKEAKS